ncbi:MAG: hypothetical protein ACK5MN_03295 [Lachnospiraceae bacterium]
MGIPVLILGASGSGKSTSMRNFSEDEVGIFNVAGKPLPFRKKLPKKNNATYSDIRKGLENPKLKKYVIDDSQYLLAFAMFDKAKDTGYGKFTDMALDFRNLIDFVIKRTPPDVIVYFLHHTEETDTGRIKAKTVGKMLDNQLTVEGLFSIVLLATTEGGNYYFITQSDGATTCKSPMDMFEQKIGNDLSFVDKTIREYWELDGGGADGE